jgi:hypothetical protein
MGATQLTISWKSRPALPGRRASQTQRFFVQKNLYVYWVCLYHQIFFLPKTSALWCTDTPSTHMHTRVQREKERHTHMHIHACMHTLTHTHSRT